MVQDAVAGIGYYVKCCCSPLIYSDNPVADGKSLVKESCV